MSAASKVAGTNQYDVMDSGTVKHTSALKESLHTLKDSGEDGFEGLLAAVLSEICGQPFRLASSGSQHGRDGNSAFDAGATYFEAKLYEGDVPRAAVSSKILDLSVDDKGQVDTWALCATSAIRAQHVDLYQEALAKFGIGCLILDWPDNTLPSLATLLAMAASTSEQFLKDHGTDKPRVAHVRVNLDAIAADSQFLTMAAGIRRLLREPGLGLGIAKAANRAWLVEAFSGRDEARMAFGQPLAPLDPKGLTWAERHELVGKLAGAFSGAPDTTAFIVIGDEGTGKSWLAAKGWLASDPAPLLTVFTADELRLPAATSDLEGMLIAKLVSQTGDTLTEAVKCRWQRRFRGWRENPKPGNIRLTVWVDGLNQAQEFPWPRWIDGAVKFLSKVGGRLIVTTNERHFARIRGVITSDVRRVIVEEWKESELKAILSVKGVASDRLSADVFNFLRNPRILGIAIELLDAKDIERFEELTVGRLLFEHIRRCERDRTSAVPAREFARALQTHAETIIARFSSQQHDDLKLFDVRLDARLKAVSQSRFFESVPGEPDFYEIRDEGLPLALGLALLGALRAEQRNGRDPAARLAEIIEPINALATTSEVIFSALQVACLEEDCPVPVQAALARYYVGLQNVPDAQWPAFEALARIAPGAFMQASRDAALSSVHLPNARWLTAALLSARSDPAYLHAITSQALAWLSLYSLAPERGMFRHPGRDPREEVEAERSRRQAEINASLAALSLADRALMENRLIPSDARDFSRLHLLALELLAGVPLSDAADALVNWAFANALNPDLHAPDKQFQHLVRFNSRDWRATREALLKACEPFLMAGTSKVGEWAAVTILRATGQSDDAARAQEIAERLTRDRPRYVAPPDDTYSATDPCDPQSDRPENIDRVAAGYERLDVSHLREGRGATAQDHHFSRALPGLARFQPEIAVEVQRRLARNAAGREGLPRRQGVIEIVPASAILEPEIVDRLIASTQAVAADGSDPDPDKRDTWITNQYALVAALPHKTGNEQLSIIAALPGRLLLLSLLDQVASADETTVESFLERVVQSGDVDAQVRVLAFIKYSHSPLSARSRSHLPHLLTSPDSMVRTQALGIVAHLRDVELLRQVVTSGWDAKSVDRNENYYELWYGSSALLAAAEAGILDPADAIDRMGVSFYGFAASRLGRAGVDAAAVRIDAALTRAASLTDIPEFPRVEQPVTTSADQAPPLLSLVHDEPAPSDMRQAFERMNETEDAFQARQRRAWQAFDRFSKELTTADARIVLDDLSWEGFETIVAAHPALAKTWMDLLAALPSSTFRSLHSFALGLARARSATDPMGVAALFRRLAAEEPFVNRVVGSSKIPAEAVAIWSSATSPEIKATCFERLDRAANDNELAVEVLAAFSAGKSAHIAEYVDAKLAAGEPAPTARALTVSGFSDLNSHANEVLERFKDQAGFGGHAYRAARYAYERNLWARQWYGRMKSAQSSEEFWRCAVLLAKIADGRYAIWEAGCGTPSEVFTRFLPTIEDQIRRRIEKWQNKRQKKLFGQDVPDPIFLLSSLSAK